MSMSVIRSAHFGKDKYWIVYSLCLWNAMCGGTLYMFPGMETDIMDQCKWKAREVDVLYSAGQFGVGLGFIPGFIFNQYGVKWSSLYACMLLIVGTFMFTRDLRAPLCGDNASLSAIWYFMIQHGGVTMYQNGLFTALSLTSKVGLTAGVISAGYGISAAIFNLVYVYMVQKALIPYFIATGILWTITALLGTVILVV